MSIACEFDYRKPKTLSKAIKLLAKRGRQTRLLAGGTDLVGWLRDSLVAPDLLVDIKGFDELKGIGFKNRAMVLGALATFSDVLESDLVAQKFPLLREMAGMVASNGVRNRATVAGNICSAVPCCDAGPVLQVYNAVVHLRGPTGKRKIPVGQWFVGPRKTAIRPGEIVTSVTVPLPAKKAAGCFVKLKRYRGEDLAQASVAVLALAGGEYRLAFGAVAPIAVRGPRTEALLKGRKLSADLLEEAGKLAVEEVVPITDIRSTKEYRSLMVEVMVRRGLKTAAARLAGKGPAYGVNVMEEDAR